MVYFSRRQYKPVFFFLKKLFKEKKCGCVIRIESESDACEYRYYILWSVCCGLNFTCINCTYFDQVNFCFLFVLLAYRSIKSRVHCDTFSGSTIFSCLGHQKVMFCTYSPQWP